MTARRRYEVKVGHGSIEILDLADLEVVLFWDCRAKERRRMAEAIIRDLDRLEPEEFLDRWSAAQPSDFA